jgi:hypothetical protein
MHIYLEDLTYYLPCINLRFCFRRHTTTSKQARKEMSKEGRKEGRKEAKSENKLPKKESNNQTVYLFTLPKIYLLFVLLI